MMMRSRLGVVRLYPLSICCFVLLASLIWGCATPRIEAPPPTPASVIAPRVEAKFFPNFVAVIAQEGDSLASLSTKYLNDPSKDWFIAEFNEIDTLKPGQELIIPLKPYEKGGLTRNGYQTVPVLSYHQFSRTEARKMVVTEAVFEEQMKLLKDKGYRVITMDQLFDFLNFTAQIPKKSVVINIDDGWRSAYEIAFPILKKYGYPATLFIYTDLITGSEKTLSWELVQEMSNNGINIECHSRTHRNFTKMEKKESFKEYFESVEKELSDSATIIKKRLNKEVKYFAYPYGDTNHLVIGLLRKKGFRGAFTVKREGNPFFIHPYRLNRSMIYGDYNLEQFEKNLAAYTEESLK
jgi:peptidoglycan/xylan/chitin deacetylase (PgdA/CDA1 family)